MCKNFKGNKPTAKQVILKYRVRYQILIKLIKRIKKFASGMWNVGDKDEGVCYLSLYLFVLFDL